VNQRLKTERLLLRPFMLSDAEDVQRLAGNKAISDTTLNIPHPYEDGMAEAWISSHQPGIEAGELAAFAITLNPGGELIGAISLKIDAAMQTAEMGYWVGEPFWDAGYCTEAARRIVEYGFKELDIRRIHAWYLRRNPASGRVMQKIGMSREGEGPLQAGASGEADSVVHYGLFRA
jgi:ribosomal-protein-alanine N-acetyltransferase